MTSRTLDLDGPVHLLDFGGEGPSILFVHGLNGSSLNWAGVGPSLAKRFRVAAIDLLGFGQSPLNGRKADLKSQAHLLVRVIHALRIAPSVLVANSMGGLAAMGAQGLAPEMVRGLVLVCPAIPHPLLTPIDPTVLALFGMMLAPGLGEILMKGHGRQSPETRVRQMMTLCCANPESLDAELLRLHREEAARLHERPWMGRASLQAARSMLKELLVPGRYRRWVKQVSCPTMVLTGEKDRLITQSAAKSLERLRPDFEHVRLAGIAHVPMLEDPQGFSAQVEAFLRNLDPNQVGLRPA